MQSPSSGKVSVCWNDFSLVRVRQDKLTTGLAGDRGLKLISDGQL